MILEAILICVTFVVSYVIGKIAIENCTSNCCDTIIQKNDDT